MLKKIFYIGLFLNCFTLLGQTYIPLLDTQNEWHFTTCYEGCITDIYYTNGDTLVNNKSHKILDGYHYISRTFLLYEDIAEKKVSLTRISPNRIDEYLLYDFGLEEGDTFEMKNPITPFPEEGGLFVLDSIRNVEIWSVTTRKHFYFSPHETNQISTQNAIWVEGVGSLSIINAPGGHPDINNVGLLNCFFKNGELFYSNLTPEVTVCEPTILSLSEDKELEIIVYYPENDKSVCYLKNTENVTKIDLLDLKGRKLVSYQNSNQNEIQFDLSSFSNGIYSLKLYSYEGEKQIKIMVSH
ncbi:T9SS type A sorting domain-containing protein [Flavobacterium sp.]|jgi:hypothetical protein|uniref:T9SS type A sorting domain-containing protein n=1 Tax=Flavobacterium sp. TaxID=239 RepID=UPI0037C040E1